MSVSQDVPSIWRFVRSINGIDHGNLIRLLQRLEAWLMIEQVAPRLVNQIPIVTLHDAIFCRAGDLSVVEAAFQPTFEEIGLSMKLKSEHWGPNTHLGDTSSRRGRFSKGELVPTR